MNSTPARLPVPHFLMRFRRSSLGCLLASAGPAALRLGGALLQLLATILIARTLGADESGDFFFWATVIMTTGQVATFGLDRLALQRVPRLGEDPKALPQFLAPIRVTALTLSLGAALLLCGYSVFVQTELSRPAWWYFLPPIGVAGVALCMINGESLVGMGRPVLGICYRHTLNAVIFASVLLIAGASLTPNLALAAYAGAFFLAGFGALLGPGLRRGASHFRLPGMAEFRGHLALGLPICLSSLFTALAYLLPLSILERTHPTEQMAFLTTSFRLFILFEVLATTVHSLAMPDLSRAAHQADRARLWKTYRGTSIKGLLLLGIPILAVALLARPVMEIFGSGFSAAAPVLRTFLIFGFVSLLLGPANHLLLMVGNTRRLAAYSLTRLTLTGILSVLLIPAFGPLAMAGALGGGVLIEKLLCLERVRRHFAAAAEPSPLSAA